MHIYGERYKYHTKTLCVLFAHGLAITTLTLWKSFKCLLYVLTDYVPDECLDSAGMYGDVTVNLRHCTPASDKLHI